MEAVTISDPILEECYSAAWVGNESPNDGELITSKLFNESAEHSLSC